jgi:hypothetical protein
MAKTAKTVKPVNPVNLDKFYTELSIAKMFVDKINQFCPLTNYDMVIEPSAGSGNILRYLPTDTVALDIAPEGPGIIQQDFFTYVSPYHPETNNIKIIVIGNPPFGTGYMNPLAKGFFNHAATFANTIAFIVPAKYHSSWKVQKQLNPDFGLYFSEILPINSFVKDGNPHNVNCCMQIWSKENLGENLRITTIPPTSHPDFDFFLTCDNVARRPLVREQLRKKEYWEFGLKYWGKIHVCDIDKVSVETTTHYVFSPKQPYVRGILEGIDWSKYVTNMGAPNVGGKSIIIRAYSDALAKINSEIDEANK